MHQKYNEFFHYVEALTLRRGFKIFIFEVKHHLRREFPDGCSDNRGQFISALVKDMARMLEESRIETGQAGNHQTPFIDRCNLRTQEYSEYNFSLEEGASFAMRCVLGGHISEQMGARDNKWIPDYIIGREAPEIEATLRLSLSGLVTFDSLD